MRPPPPQGTTLALSAHDFPSFWPPPSGGLLFEMAAAGISNCRKSGAVRHGVNPLCGRYRAVSCVCVAPLHPSATLTTFIAVADPTRADMGVADPWMILRRRTGGARHGGDERRSGLADSC